MCVRQSPASGCNEHGSVPTWKSTLAGGNFVRPLIPSQSRVKHHGKIGHPLSVLNYKIVA